MNRQLVGKGGEPMWGTCDRCQRRVTSEATIVQLQHGELVRLTDGLPRMKSTGAAQFHTVCRPCGSEIAAYVQALMDQYQAGAHSA